MEKDLNCSRSDLGVSGISNEMNIPFYERLGFRVTGELQVPDGPKLWPMLREPGVIPYQQKT